MYLTSWQRYLHERPQLATDLDLGKLHPEPDLEKVINTACVDLITLLGMARVLPVSAPAGSLEHPATWREKQLRTTISRTEVTPSGVEIALQVSAGDAPIAAPHAENSGDTPTDTGAHVSKEEGAHPHHRPGR